MSQDVLSIELVVNDQNAAQVINRFQNQLGQTQIVINQFGRNTVFGNNLSSQFEQAEAKAKKFNSSVKELFNTFGLAFGATAAVGLTVKVFKDSTEAAFEAERANRKLSASATEAGLAYGVLAEKNKEFANSAGLSVTAATNITAKIAQLATFSGKPENIDKLQKSFLDLSAAKGINSGQIDDLIGTILSGQDEGLNRLGISDPGQLYKAYAKEVGKTADQLSQFEKVQAASNAVMEKAAIFAGANSDKMQSLSGQAEKASANLDNLYTNLGQGLTQSIEFRNFLNFANEALGSFTTNLQNVKKELGDGLSPRNAAIKEGNKAGNQILDAVGDFFSPVGATIGFGIDAISGKSTKEATDNFIASLGGTHKRRIEALTQNFAAEQKLIQQQNKDAEEQKKQLAGKTFATAFQSQIDSFIKPASDGVEKTRITLEQLNKLQKDFTANFQKFNQSQAELAQKGIQTAAKVFYTDSAETALKRFDRDPNLQDAQTNLQALNKIKKFLPEEKFEQYSDKLSDFIKQASEKTLKLKDDFRDALISSYETDNPFVKLMSDFESATDRARDKYKEFTKLFGSTEIADKIADIEKANLSKAIGLQKFENNFDALKLRQEAQKLAAAPERQFADFQRGLEKVNQTAEFATSINSLNRKLAEANFYADKYNPNNPKSFAEFNRRGFNDDISDVGVQIRNAVADIESLQNIGLEGTGISGKGAIADKILAAIPNRDELLKRLNSPFANVRGDADFLLRQQSSALFDKKQFETQKFQDFLEDQKAAQFGKQFANEQIGLINEDKFLTDAQKAQRRLSVTDALGNDLDPRLKRQRFQDFLVAAQAKEKQADAAFKIADDTKKAVESILKALTEKGIKIDQPTGGDATVGITIKDETNGAASILTRSPTTADTAREYDDALRDSNFRIGDSHKAGSLYRSNY